jgi:murein DD-endopeptidase MepM/ murein hydrolase activator NlpD
VSFLSYLYSTSIYLSIKVWRSGGNILKYRWGDAGKEDYDYQNSWDTYKKKQSIGLGAAFGQRRFQLPVINTLWLKQTLVTIILGIVLLSVMAWDSPALIGVQQNLRYLIAEERSDYTPVLETFVREGLWLDPYERHVFNSLTRLETEDVMSIPVSGQFARGYGWIESPVSGNRTFHSGIDIETEVSALVRAALTGVVVKIDYTDSLGRVILLDHGNGLTTLYGTLGEILVEVDQKVQQGEIIAKTGTLKSANRGQLHFEVRVNNKPIDPLEKITNVKTRI